MRLSEWAERAPHEGSMTPKVMATRRARCSPPSGAETTRHAGSHGATTRGARYAMLIPTPAGLIQVHVRVNVPQEGPRSSGKLVRWNRVQTGELAIETRRVTTHQLPGRGHRAPRHR